MSWLHIVTTLLGGAIALLAYLVNDLLKKRKALKGLPQPPMQNLLMGHLYIADQCMTRFPKNTHAHTWPDYIREKYDQSETFYVDWRPFGPLWLYTADPELAAEHALVKQSLPKSHLETDYLDQFLGKNNLISLEGHKWKTLRSMFNPGFSANNIMTYTDAIVEASLRFRTVLEEKARTNELFELEEYATRLTIDIIGIAVFDVDMDAQRGIHPIVQYFRERVLMMPPASAVFPWQGVDLLRPLKLWRNARKLDDAIVEQIKQKIERRAKDIEAEAQGRKGPKKRSIIDLALNAYEKEVAMDDFKGVVKQIMKPEDMPQSLRKDLVDSIKTFFFAGHDTTSSTICWAYYLLHRYPEKQKRLARELDTIFPPGTSAPDAIRKDPYIINKLEYTTAVVKETMRIFPPASTLRAIDASRGEVPESSTITDSRTGQILPLKGTHIWPVAHLMMRNKRFFPEPRQFIPERFILGETPFPEAELFTAAGKYAYQPFSVGPRNCIGQELAMVEGKIILALTAREVDFVLEYPGERPDPQPPIPENTAIELDKWAGKERNVLEGHRVWQTLSGSAKPNGRCPGRIYLRKERL